MVITGVRSMEALTLWKKGSAIDGICEFLEGGCPDRRGTSTAVPV
jgi:hypothetical protein